MQTAEKYKQLVHNNTIIFIYYIYHATRLHFLFIGVYIGIT